MNVKKDILRYTVQHDVINNITYLLNHQNHLPGINHIPKNTNL
jgi:hypothetical protein